MSTRRRPLVALISAMVLVIVQAVMDPTGLLALVGWSGAGTRGRRLVDGEEEVRIFGEFVPVRAHIERLDNLSAHADSREILRWLGGFKRAPEKVFLVHGEPGAQEALKDKIVEKFGWRPDTVEIPEYLQKFEL